MYKIFFYIAYLIACTPLPGTEYAPGKIIIERFISRLKTFENTPCNIYFTAKNVFDEMSIFIDSRVRGLNAKDGCIEISKIPNSTSYFLHKDSSVYYQYYIVDSFNKYIVEISYRITSDLTNSGTPKMEILITCFGDDSSNLQAEFCYSTYDSELSGWLRKYSDGNPLGIENQEEKLNQILEDAFLKRYFDTFEESEFSLENIGICTKIFD